MNAVTQPLTHIEHTFARICAEFDLHSARLEVIEVDTPDHRDGAPRLFTNASLAQDLARFSIDGRSFVIRRKGDACSNGKLQPSKLARSLTGREMQIVELVAQGLRNKQIASHLDISEYTVAAYVKQICQKLDVHNRTAVAARWLHDSLSAPMN
ncbi:MAG TPA: LuxR C-terminal-related transcriptional regulator [Burkholderiaceae bacterium]|nr:LuxR C-terminal-related transcriptional regulator [Burkholderiaceae bacterium]